ncbi:MAG TPA: Uma2 family endonuclease [Polyangiaceae bacterium]|nr:Uma2 family endonuclease [Polyangiaceae bacterium]
MTAPAKRLATYADLLALPDDARGEIVAGDVVLQPSPTPLHQSTIGEVYAELRNPFQRGRGGPGGWWLIQDVDVEFGPHDICRPDVSGWRRERVPQFPSERPVAQRPDWVCEALSPSTAVRDQGDKRAIYERAGVPWYWIVDPQNRTLTVLRLVADGYVVTQVVGDSGAVALPPFDAIAIDLASVFPPAE